MSRPNKQRDARLLLTRAPELDSAVKDGRLDIPQFLAARKAEIQHLEAAMRSSKMSSKTRAFQTLPRWLRRRTASHNVKRIPRRLRKRAVREMERDQKTDVKKKTLRGYKRKKAMAQERKLQKGNPVGVYNLTGVNSVASPPIGKLKYQHRQKGKVWLPTHVWHAKRAHTEVKWGFKIVKRPTLKSYRLTHRSSTIGGAIAWDKSYYSDLFVTASEKSVLIEIVALISNNLDATRGYIVNGSRCWEGLIYQNSDILGPALIYFPKVSQDEENKLYIRVHPAIFDTLFQYLNTLNADSQFTIYDHRYTLGSIDITGPLSLPSLHCILHIHDSESSEMKKAWRQLSAVNTVQSLPRGAVLSFKAKDPRFSYPPYLRNSHVPQSEIIPLITNWPTELFTKDPELFKKNGINDSYKYQSNQKEIERRKRNLAPGSSAPYAETDPALPVTIFKNSNNSLTLLLPWGWVMPVWHSLMHLNDIHLGGIEQEHQIAYESGNLYFPHDYPFTQPGISNELEISNLKKMTWSRKPTGKRVEYSRLRIRGPGSGRGEDGSPFKCDWEYLKELNGKSSLQYSHPKSDIDAVNLTPVRISYINRGAPNSTARVYRYPKDVSLTEAYDCPSANELIGFVTTGSFNLKEGNGSGIANLHLKDNERLEGLCLVRNVGSKICRPAKYSRIIL